jgi:CheY-like chemotaxis protein
MNMKILIVEDDPTFSIEVQTIISALPGPPTYNVAKSRASAEALLESEFFDLVILDLNIPTVDGSLDLDVSHGRALLNLVRQDYPGIPIFVLTGSPAEDFVADLVGNDNADIWGENKRIPTLFFLKKVNFDELRAKLTPLATAVWGLTEIELVRDGSELSVEEERLILIFARRFAGRRCQIARINTGLSSAKVLRVNVRDSNGALVVCAVAKLAPIAAVRDEAARFERIVGRLPSTSTPRKLLTQEHGAKAHGGIFYELAEGFDKNVFEVLGESSSSQIPLLLKDATERWRRGVPESSRSIKDIRRLLLSDSALAEICAKINISLVNDLEVRTVQSRWCSAHRDLHGINVLVHSSGICIFIDYGDVGEGPACLDPVTLEFSIFFHPNGPLKASAWPSVEQASKYFDLEAYLVGCPCPEFIRGCRIWSDEVSVGIRERAAVTYAYLIRQMSYEDTDKKRVLAFLDGVQQAYFSA